MTVNLKQSLSEDTWLLNHEIIRCASVFASTDETVVESYKPICSTCVARLGELARRGEWARLFSTLALLEFGGVFPKDGDVGDQVKEDHDHDPVHGD